MTTPIDKNIHSKPLCLELFGDIKDAIYQLGHLDSEDVNLAWHGLSESSYFGPSILKSPLHKIFSRVFARQTKLFKNKEFQSEYHDIFRQFIEHYAQGLGVSNEDALYLCFMHEFLNNPSAIFDGISDDHLYTNNCEKLINSPNQKFFYNKLRFVTFNTNENLKALVLQNLATPFVPYGGINEAGLSLKLVQRDAVKVNYDGLSASFIALVVLLGFDNIDKAANFLLKQELVFHWEFHLSDKNGQSRKIAIDGKNSKELSSSVEEVAVMNEMIKLHTKLYIKDHLPLTLAIFELNPEQIGLSLFDSSREEINHYQLDGIFTENINLVQKSSKIKKEVANIFKVKNLLNKAQVAFNENRDEDCYHTLQLAIVYAKKHFKKDKKLLAKLTLNFLTCQYIFESHKETYQFIHKQLLDIYEDLDSHHKDLALILMQRLQILMDVKVNLIDVAHHSKRIIFTESKLGRIAHTALKKSTLLRPNHLDYCPINGL